MFSPALDIYYLQDFDIATIYAIDNLLLNVDRRVDKSNMILKNERAFLIDHELTFATAPHAINDLVNKHKWRYNYKRHIFYQLVKAGYSNTPEVFQTFSYYLKDVINVKGIIDIVQELHFYGHPTSQFEAIFQYLEIAKLYE